MYKDGAATQNVNKPVRESISHSIGEEHSPRRRSRSRKSRTSARKLVLLQVALVVTIGVAFLAALAGVMHSQKLSRENSQLYLVARKQQKEITEAQALIKELTSERDALVEGRIPGLKAVVYDETLEIGTGYVRNIIFTLTRANGKDTYEYKLVAENQTLEEIKPRVFIRFYDDVGTQVGGAEIGAPLASDSYNSDPLDPDYSLLKPDEIRSYSDQLDVIGGGVPKYFTLIVQ